MEREAVFDKEVFQNSIEETDLEYIAEKHQPYFQFEKDGEKFLIGMNMILECLAIADKIGETPPLGNGFWGQVNEKFHVNFYEYEVESCAE